MNPNQSPTLPQQSPVAPQMAQGAIQAGGMKPTLQGSLHPMHNQIYDMLRNTLMQLHQQGVPGMDKVLGALNQQHVTLVSPHIPQRSMQTPHIPQQGGM